MAERIKGLTDGGVDPVLGQSGMDGDMVWGCILPPPGTAPGAPKSATSMDLGFWEAQKRGETREANEEPIRQIGAVLLLHLLIAEAN